MSTEPPPFDTITDVKAKSSSILDGDDDDDDLFTSAIAEPKPKPAAEEPSKSEMTSGYEGSKAADGDTVVPRSDTLEDVTHRISLDDDDDDDDDDLFKSARIEPEAAAAAASSSCSNGLFAPIDDDEPAAAIKEIPLEDEDEKPFQVRGRRRRDVIQIQCQAFF